MIRPRRNRKSRSIRDMIQETHVLPQQLILPLFALDSEEGKEEISSLPGNFRFGRKDLIREIEECIALGIKGYMLFPVIPNSRKDKKATYSYAPDNFYLKRAKELKERFGSKIVLYSDVAMDPYSSDGHDGIYEDGEILNDETLPILAKMSVAQAKAGFDIIGPSDMMDRRVHAIRTALDKEGYIHTGILSYTAKYASAFYGPFRDALDSAPKNGDKKSYQMNPANRKEAMIEADLDIAEGADMIMVKPALHYMDIIRKYAETYDVPIVCYHVSGECAMLIAACRNGWLHYEQAMPETLIALKRAGADIIITYFAKDYAKIYAQVERNIQ